MGRKAEGGGKVKISVRDLSFGYAGKKLFEKFSADFEEAEAGRPLLILGPSGCGKTTLLKLLGGLLKPDSGRIIYTCNAVPGETAHIVVEGKDGGPDSALPKTAFMFQESRLLPWLTVLENVSLPLEREMGKEKAGERAMHFLSLVFLEEKKDSYPNELSGGQLQRVSMARAFAWPAQALFMDEPFQSLDVPLRMSLMDLCLSLLEKEKRILIAVTHDPREAVYIGGRIIILGKRGEGKVFDRVIHLSPEERAYGSAAGAELEREMIQVLRANSA